MPLVCRTALTPIVACLASALGAQEVTNPVYRVPAGQSQQAENGAKADPNVTPAAAPGAGRPPGLEESPFDIKLAQGEHPLMPCIRLAEQGLAEINANIKGYSCVMTKQERIDGEVGPPQRIAVNVRHEPFSIYMKFIQPFAGREVLYNAARDKTKLVAMEGSGLKRRFGKVNLPIDGWMAMDGQRYPITMTGVKYLTEELLRIAKQDVKYGECEVQYAVHNIGGRPCTMIKAIHPKPRRNFRFHIARIFVDHELRIPTGYDAYSWPTEPGGKPELEESYFYTNVKLNPGFTDADFDPENPALFK